jgi:hypothetical protein
VPRVQILGPLERMAADPGELRMPHHARCPAADRFRRRGGKGAEAK